nr:copia protein [Tanacetum cinerariifolium]
MTGDDNHDGDHPETSNTTPLVPPPTSQIPHTISSIKLPIRKKGEFDIWAMKMEHYLCHTDFPIWQVIQNGNGHVSVTTDTNGMIKVLPPKTAKEVVARERERKARTNLLMALPEDHLAIHKMADAKEMWEAIKSRFCGNDKSKKVQKYLLKQQFEGFFVSTSECLHKGHDRFQTLLSQLEIHGAGVSHEEAKQKFLRSLPSSWSQVDLIMRTEPGLDTLSFDDLYNNLRVFERDVKGTTASSSNTQNVAFVSADNTNNNNDVSTAYSVASPFVSKSQKEGSASHTDEVIHSFFANQSSAPQLDYDDLEQINDDDMEEIDLKWQINDDDMEEIDLKWQVAMISMRIKKFHKRTRRKLDCRAKWNQDSMRRDVGYNGNKAKDNGRRPAYQDDLKDLVTIDGEDIYWSGHVTKDAQKYAMMAYSYSNSGFNNEASDVESDSKPIEYGSCKSDPSVETPTSLPKPVDNAPKDDPHRALKDKGIIDSGCSRHMTGSKAYLADYQEFKGGSVAFRVSNGRITGKGKIKDGRLNGIKREYSNARTTQQNGVTERKNMTFIKAARTMLADSLLPTTFWAEAVNTPCYVLNRVLVTKPQNKTPYELLTGKFNGKSNLGFLVGYSLNRKAFRVSNLETKRVKENLHVNFLENKPNVGGKGHAWMFDLGYLTNFMNYEPVSVENQANKFAGPKEANNNASTQDNDDQGKNSEEVDLHEELFVLHIWSAYSTTIKSSGDKIEKNTNLKAREKPVNQVEQIFLEELEKLKRQEKKVNDEVESLRKEATHDTQNAITSSTNLLNTVSTPLSVVGPSRAFNDDEPSYTNDPSMPHLEDIDASPSEGIFNDSSYDEEGVQTKSKVNKNSVAHALALEGESWVDAMQEELMKFQIQKSSFMYGIINEEVYVSQPPGFVDHKFPNKVYKVLKALYGLHPAPRAWYATLSTFLDKSGYRIGAIDESLFIKQDKKDTMLVQVYVDDIIFGSTKKSWCDEFEELMKNRFQMSSMGELTFFLGLHVKRKADGIFISQDKYVAKILKKFDFLSMKTASTPTETQKPLVKDEVVGDVDVTLKTSHLQAVKRIFRNPTIGGCQFLGRRLFSWQCKKLTIMATSTTKAEYVAVAHCRGQVLWIQNQLFDYGFNIMNIKIYIDNESTVCIVKNPVFHSKTKHIKIKHQFIRDAYGKKLIQSCTYGIDGFLKYKFDEKDRIGVTAGDLKLLLSGILLLLLVMKLVLFGLTIVAAVTLMMLVIINNQVEDLSSHNTKYTSPALTQKVFINVRRVSKGFSEVETPLFASMLVQPQAHDAKEEAPAPSPPPQDSILTPPQAQPATPPSPPRERPTTTFASSMTLLNSLLETCATLEKKKSKSSGLKRLRKVGTSQRVKSFTEIVMGAKEDASKQGGKIAEMDADVDITLVDMETQVDMDAELQGRIDDDNGATKEVNAAEPTVFDDEEVTVSMAQTLIKMKAKKARLLNEQMAKRLHDEEVEKAAAREKQKKDDLERAQVRPLFEREYKKVQTMFKPDKDVKEPTKKRVAKKTLLQKSFRKLQAVAVLVAEFKVEALQVKYPIIDYEIHFEGFDKDDLVALWRLVKEKFSTAVPTEDKEKALWVELKKLFEPNAADVFWKLQRYMHDPLTWKLYTNCEIHPPSIKLQVDEDCEMCRDLVMKIFMEANKPKSRSLDTSSK